MRRTLLTLAILGLVWIGYMAWPVYDLFVLIRAIETHDVNTVTRRVYFDAVRLSLTNQVLDAYLPRSGIEIGPLRRNIAAAAIANPVVQKLISVEALSQLHAWLAGNCGVRCSTARLGRNNYQHDRNLLADFSKFGV